MANRRVVLFGALAIAFAVCGAYFNYSWLSSQEPGVVTHTDEAGIELVSVVTAKGDLAAGEALREVQLTTRDWPKSYLPPGAILSLESARGRVARRTLLEGEAVLESALLPIGAAGGLSPIIAEGKRAVAVKVDEVIGIAGFVKPGAHVDVLATIRDRTARNTGSFARVILQDVRVLALDQTLEKGDSGEPKSGNVVTLEVSPEEAQKLTFAAHEGQLQLALRNPTDEKVVGTAAVNARSLRHTARAPRRSTNIQVIKGLDVSSKNF
jgi:pilus assembly protein CpaB